MTTQPFRFSGLAVHSKYGTCRDSRAHRQWLGVDLLSQRIQGKSFLRDVLTYA